MLFYPQYLCKLGMVSDRSRERFLLDLLYSCTTFVFLFNTRINISHQSVASASYQKLLLASNCSCLCIRIHRHVAAGGGGGGARAPPFFFQDRLNVFRPLPKTSINVCAPPPPPTSNSGYGPADSIKRLEQEIAIQ